MNTLDLISIENQIASELQSFDIDINHGFLRGKEPLRRLPTHLKSFEQYEVWEKIIDNLSQLIIAQKLQSTIDNMPLIDNLDPIIKNNDLRIQQRCKNVLSFLANGYVFQNQIVNQPPAKSIPKSLAIPLYKLSSFMQLAPNITHENMVLNNYRFLSNNKKDYTLNNIGLNNLFLGGIDESWFFLCAFGIESFGGNVLKYILTIQKVFIQFKNTCDKNNNNNNGYNEKDKLFTKMTCIIKDCLKTLSKTIDKIRLMLLNNYIKLDSYIFYKRVRIFLQGFENGVEFIGISKNMAPLPGSKIIESKSTKREYLTLSCNGASAAQCSVFPCLDLFFGLTTQQDPFLQEMKNYMPLLHRQFIFWLINKDENRFNMVDIINYLKKTIRNDTSSVLEIEKLYEECVSQLRTFRTTHMKIANDYIVVPAARLNKNKVQGTGGSSVLPYLEGLRNSTHPMSKL